PPLRCLKAEEGLRGHDINDSDAILAFGKDALTQVNPRTSWRASKEFRLQLIEELSKRALKEAIKKAGGEIDA
ncbi:MAG: xanthine dehydrogenase FAD-binding subunit XdhB, partial [Clostridiales bacterium]|nr:xanthine dehydrogenase FAD-binding subunit XdhB [Clostridiales bacterium]